MSVYKDQKNRGKNSPASFRTECPFFPSLWNAPTNSYNLIPTQRETEPDTP